MTLTRAITLPRGTFSATCQYRNLTRGILKKIEIDTIEMFEK